MASSNDGATGDKEPIRLRAYQDEMLQESLARNVIVAMDTGSGKTHIAVARIRHELESMEPGKLIWFMTPGRALSEQQCTVLQENLPGYHVRSLTGADGVDKWTDQRLWDAFLKGLHVVVGTPAVLLDALTHGFVTMTRLTLLVFDEVHRCTKNHPMNKIMKDFYHPAKARGNTVPHVLGLSASPVWGGKISNLSVIENDLNAITVTPKEHRIALQQHVHRPDVFQITFAEQDLQPPLAQTTPAYAALTREVFQYDVHNDPYVLELQERDDAKARRLLEKTMLNRKTYCKEQITTVLNRAGVLFEQLGYSTAEWYTRTCLHRFLDSQSEEAPVLLPDLSDKEQQHLTRILSRVFNHVPNSSDHNLDGMQDVQRQTAGVHEAGHVEEQAWDLAIGGEAGMSDKALWLRDTLLKHADTADFCGIIFVQQRATVTALARVLRSIPEIGRLLNIGTFVGTSVNSKRKASIADLADLRTQAQDLADFRNGVKNLMIATDVLEEGIDIPACNAVFCFDLPTNLVSFVQRRGRARQTSSKYFLFISKTDLKTDPAKWQHLEDRMIKAYMDDSREVGSAEEAEEAEDEEQMAAMKYLVPSTGALLTMDNAKAHLYHFCAVSVRGLSRYIDPRPEFDPQKVQRCASKPTWKARVILPAFIHTSIRIAESSSEWKREDAAIKDAAFMAYTNLHKAGLITDSLLPPLQESQIDPGKKHVDQPSLVPVSEQWSMWKSMAQHLSRDHARWHAVEVSLHLKGRHFATQLLWLPMAFPSSVDSQLYWNADTVYQAQITPLPDNSMAATDAQVPLMVEATNTILRTVFDSRMSDSKADNIPFLITPPGNIDLRSWVDSSRDTIPAAQCARLDADNVDLGLVDVAGQDNRHYILCEMLGQGGKGLNGTSTQPARNDPSEPELLLTAFPKRRDFLHPPSEKAHTAKQAFPISQCAVSKLPGKIAIFAAFVPCLLHEIDVSLLIQALQSGDVLVPVGIQDRMLVKEAITAPSAGPGDYNRLEYLGDTILKFCTELQVLAQHPIAPEAYLSAEKDRIVRNDSLAKVALDSGLDRYILTKAFTGNKWRPPYVDEIIAMFCEQKREMSTKVLADVVEALIGAAYVDGGLDKAYMCIRSLLVEETWWDLGLIFDKLHAELHESHVSNLGLLEGLIGHEFRNKSLLTEAITHASYPHNNTGMSYERLEFFGDAVLDLIVTPKLHAHPSKLRHWDLHRTHEALVNGHFLGFCCMMYTGREVVHDVVDTGSVKAPQLEIHERGREYHLHDFIRASGELLKAKHASIIRFDKLQAQVRSSLENGNLYPWADLIAMHPDKFISDIVEAILGALYIDTRGDLSVCEIFAEKIGILPTLRRILDSGMETAFPKERLGILADREHVKYNAALVEDGSSKLRTWECVVTIGSKIVAKAEGCGSKEEAEVRGADLAADKLARAIGQQGGRRRRKLDMRFRAPETEADTVDGAAGTVDGIEQQRYQLRSKSCK